MKNKLIILIVLMCILNTAIIFADNNISSSETLNGDQNNVISTYVHGKIMKVEQRHEEGAFSYDYQYCTVLIQDGKYSGEIVNVENVFSENLAYNIVVKKGDHVILNIDDYGDTKEVNIADHCRQHLLYILVIIFLLTLILVGRIKGVKSVITISLTIILIYKLLLPAILKGINPLLITIFIAGIITFLTILMISGIHKKSFSAIIGTLIGVIISGVIAIISGNIVKLTGLSSHEATMLMYLPQEINFNFKYLLFSGILLGSLGAVMDVSMSIASSIYEIYNTDNTISGKQLFNSGMTVGQDIMGTMSNTLILAYTGSSIPLLLIFLAYKTPSIVTLNMDLIATEIVRSLAGSIGLILTIPITASISVLMLKYKTNKTIK